MEQAIKQRQMLEELGKVIALGVEPNGLNINDKCGYFAQQN